MLTLFKDQRHKTEQEQDYVAIREMTLLGGNWVGERHKWSPPDDDPIRLEIFYGTPSAILDQADNILLRDYPQLTKPLPNKLPRLDPSVISFTLRNKRNDLLAIASLKFSSTYIHGAIIRQIVVADHLRGYRNGSFLLKELETYASKISRTRIATKILHFMATDFYFKNGYEVLSEREINLGTKFILCKQLPEYSTLPQRHPRQRV